MAQDAQYGSQRFLTLTLGNELFAIDIFSVREILDYTDITRIPQCPEHMLGVVNLRGNAIPVMDLRLKLGLGPTPRTVHTRIIILEVEQNEETIAVGVMADAVRQVLELDPSQLKPPPRMGSAIRADLITAVGKVGDAFLFLLDIRRVLLTEDLTDQGSKVPQAIEAETATEEGGSHEAVAH